MPVLLGVWHALQASLVCRHIFLIETNPPQLLLLPLGTITAINQSPKSNTKITRSTCSEISTATEIKTKIKKQQEWIQH
ncbi:hypothetical protein O3M35_009249 [Rhynocoris fuscipes]|uniref:Secreted protein n=1 Tax=Rhynocoris fuscipes TaxID=488301 RepID=A0AAW1D337_9HEMI